MNFDLIMLRYELQGFSSCSIITDKHWFKEPNLIIRIDVPYFGLLCRIVNPSWNRAYVLVKFACLLLETPWSIVVSEVQSSGYLWPVVLNLFTFLVPWQTVRLPGPF